MTKRTFFLLVILGFCAMHHKTDALSSLGKPILSGPSHGFEKSFVEFYCKLDNIQTNESILCELYNEGNFKKVLGVYVIDNQEEAIFPAIISLAYDGKLICKASVQNNISPSFSDPMDFQVLVPVRGAHIISNTFLEDLWEGDNLTLLCNISKGTYVLYDWFLNDTLIRNDSSNNQLRIPSLSSQDSGEYTCVAKNILNETHYSRDKSKGRSIHVKDFTTSFKGKITDTTPVIAGKDSESESDDDEVKVQERISINKCIQMTTDLIEAFEQRTEQEILTLYLQTDRLIKEKLKYMKQTMLDNWYKRATSARKQSTVTHPVPSMSAAPDASPDDQRAETPDDIPPESSATPDVTPVKTTSIV